ncbi:hypothetical protein IV203_021678 [Nitzschia inconspicua]|uniref:Uncharacterized protein n=1 Tax=Nitzschia inconspicua TaxID=303405 RepID=A0A9K3KHE0_9STRA|nr:hypothetical protein IV203_022769 [Nitzschia inconspicua]KAG7343670.1 hypothetical protein IV203_021678 [Nitzschia inconspicua]
MTDLDDLELQKKLLDNEVAAAADVIIIRDRSVAKGFSLRSCLLKTLCWIMVVFFGLTALLAGAMFFWTRNVVQHLTVTESQTFPIVDMSDTEVDYLGSRVKIFMDQLLLQKVPQEDLVVTQDEINGLLGHSDYLRGNMYVTLKPGTISEEYSLPMDGLPGGHGRYFLGHDYTTVDEKAQRVELKMETAAKHEDWFIGPLFFLQLHFESKDFEEYHQHLLELFIENGSIFGSTIPDDVINEHMNILDGFYEQEDSGEAFRAIVNGIESVTIEEGRIVIKPRRSPHDETVMEEHDVVIWDVPPVDTAEFEDHGAAFWEWEESSDDGMVQTEQPSADLGLAEVEDAELVDVEEDMDYENDDAEGLSNDIQHVSMRDTLAKTDVDVVDLGDTEDYDEGENDYN